MVSKNNKDSGFSLIEVAIALMVISLLMTPLIAAYNIHMDGKRRTITTGRADIVRAALLKFYERNGFYPTPAQPNIAQGIAGFGIPATIGGGWPFCTVASTVVCRANNTGTFGTTPPVTNGVLIGSVPIAALGIPFKSMLDGYGSRLTYAVSENLTSVATFSNDRGAITVNNLAGTPSQAHFIIISHGKTREGAFSLGGVQGAACNTLVAPIPADSENCDNDDIFLSNEDGGGKTQISEGGGITFFDDTTSYINTTSYGLWSYIPNTALNMQSGSAGNIMIGCTVAPCEPVAKVDVVGDVKANEVQTTRICDSTQAGCLSAWTSTNVIAPRLDNNTVPLGWFSPDMLTGAPTSEATAAAATTYDSATTEGYIGEGIRCYKDFALKGIKDYDEYCAGTLPTSTPYLSIPVPPINCSGATPYVTGINITGVNSFTFICGP